MFVLVLECHLSQSAITYSLFIGRFLFFGKSAAIINSLFSIYIGLLITNHDFLNFFFWEVSKMIRIFIISLQGDQLILLFRNSFFVISLLSSYNTDLCTRYFCFVNHFV